jgi:hypothetical protein
LDRTLSAAFAAMATLASPAHALLISNSDAWQHTNIASIAAPTLHPASSARDMFGGSFAPSEPGNTVFNDNSAQGTLHIVQWTLVAPITLGSINLVAAHDGTPERDQTFRGFGAFTLRYLDAANVWQTLLSVAGIGTTAVFPDGSTHPVYGGGPNYPNIAIYEYFSNVAPTTAATWEISFQQFGPANGHSSGPRIVELDGYVHQNGTPVPEPTTVVLLGAGLLGLAGIRRATKR